jgi:hypothetical protein
MNKLLFVVLTLIPLPAFADENTDDVAPEVVAPSRDTHVKFWSIDGGVRTTFIKDAAYDPYSRNDALTQFSLGMARTTIIRGNFSFAPGFRWDFGSSNATARGAETNLLAHRLTVPLEARLHAESWLYVFGRFAPGVMYQRSRVKDGALAEAMTDSGWVPAADVSAGVSMLFASFSGSPTSHAPRFWITPEVGYAWAGRASAALSPKTEADDPRAFGTLSMTGVAVRGAFLRVNITTTF